MRTKLIIGALAALAISAALAQEVSPINGAGWLQRTNNLSDLVNTSTALVNLGVNVNGALKVTTGGVASQAACADLSNASSFCSGTNAANLTGTMALARLANIGAGDVLGNSTSGSATPADTTVTALLDQALGNTQGNVIYRGASTWAVLATGTSGQTLITQGASANPKWAGGTNGNVAPANISCASCSTSSFTMGGLSNGTTVFTPTRSGNVSITIGGQLISTVTTANTGLAYQIQYGTGNGPANGAALTGTQCSTIGPQFRIGTTLTAAVDMIQPFQVTCEATGLTVGTAYYVDLAQKQLSGSGVSINQGYITWSEN